MLFSINQLYGDKIGALDGEIGHVKDCYFDDRKWAVRYLVADTGSWLPGRQVLLSPHAIGQLYQPGKLLLVNLTRKQIEDSPSIESHKPVSRQYEEEYHRYYGRPFYWMGDDLWGMSGVPIVDPPIMPVPVEHATTRVRRRQGRDAHLRSTKAMHGYRVRTSNGTGGHLHDFMLDEQNWAIRQLVIQCGHRLSGTEVELPTSKVDRISCDEVTVYVKMTCAEVEHSPTHHVDSIGAAA